MVATEAQVEEQKKWGLKLGCHICNDERKQMPMPPTHKWLNPFCVGCKKLYCAEHESKIDTHFCSRCLVDSNKEKVVCE